MTCLNINFTSVLTFAGLSFTSRWDVSNTTENYSRQNHRADDKDVASRRYNFQEYLLIFPPGKSIGRIHPLCVKTTPKVHCQRQYAAKQAPS